MQEYSKKAVRNVLVVTDFSKSSANAIYFAAKLLKHAELKFVLLNCYVNPDEKSTLLISLKDILQKKSERALEKQVSEMESLIEKKPLEISTYSEPGKLKKAMDTITGNEEIDLMVAGIPSAQYQGKIPVSIPLLFMGQGRYPLLLVPEDCNEKDIKNILVLNMNPIPPETSIKKGLEHIINHDHLSRHTININERDFDSAKAKSLGETLSRRAEELIIIIPSPGDRIDKSLMEYRIQELCPAVGSLLNCYG
jgi:hypothetical protein